MKDIPGFEKFAKVEPINKGWSEDKKFYVETADGRRVFLRVSDKSNFDCKKDEHDMMKRAYELGVPTSQPYEFGLCDGGKSCYSISCWLDGEDAASVLPEMKKTEQFALGIKSGEVLRKIHLIPAPDDAELWNIRFNRKVQYWVEEYNAKQQIHSDIGAMLIAYLDKHRDVLDACPLTFIHGDYNAENIIVMPDGEIKVIDFSNYNSSYGDPWWDMNNMAWMPTMQPHYYTGQIKGLFQGEPPKEYWKVLSYYLAYDALAALVDPYGLNGIEDGTAIVNNILAWTNNFQNPVPTWYLKDFYI